MSDSSYIGKFDILSGNLVITDPQINDIYISKEHISPSVCVPVRITRVKRGAYNAYHMLDGSTGSKSLIVLHEDFDAKDLQALQINYMGQVDCGTSGTVCLCDEVEIFNSRNCYDKISKQSFYSIKKLIDLLKRDGFFECEDFRSFLLSQKDDYVQGAQLLDIVSDYSSIPDMRLLDYASTQWSDEIINRVKMSSTHSCIMRGCVASLSFSFFRMPLKCFMYTDCHDHPLGYKILLTPEKD